MRYFIYMQFGTV